MEDRKTLDTIDQSILRILSAYGRMTPLELWYEIGEDDKVQERVIDSICENTLSTSLNKGIEYHPDNPSSRATKGDSKWLFR